MEAAKNADTKGRPADEAFLMQRGDGRILISFYKGVHSHTDASDVPDEPSPDTFAHIGGSGMEPDRPKLIQAVIMQADEGKQPDQDALQTSAAECDHLPSMSQSLCR